jgi:hypothetical protein
VCVGLNFNLSLSLLVLILGYFYALQIYDLSSWKPRLLNNLNLDITKVIYFWAVIEFDCF